MTDEILDAEVIEDAEPPTVDELISHLVTDIQSGNDAEVLASEVLEDFILADRPEAAQILMMLEMDTPTLLHTLKVTLNQALQETFTSIDQRGAGFIEDLKRRVKNRLTEMAAANGQ